MQRSNKAPADDFIIEFDAAQSAMFQYEGMKPMSAIVNPEYGPETVLQITTDDDSEFDGLENADLRVKTGAIKTKHGDIIFLLCVISPTGSNDGLALDYIMNPHEPQHMAHFQDLAKQEYWHVIITDSDGNERNIFEFENTYGLESVLAEFRKVKLRDPGKNFIKAKAEYLRDYPVEDLLAM